MAVLLLFRPDLFLDRLSPEYRPEPAAKVYEVARAAPDHDRLVMVIRGTNIEGDFTCRAPKGDCAPSQVIDARATKDLSASGPVHDGLRRPVSVASGDQGRTSERTLRIVFPAHIDETGTLHDDAVAWAVVENPRWAAELRRKAGEDTAPPLMRQLRRQLTRLRYSFTHNTMRKRRCIGRVRRRTAQGEGLGGGPAARRGVKTA